jgi:hypothetical protein
MDKLQFILPGLNDFHLITCQTTPTRSRSACQIPRPLIFNETNTQFPSIDCAALHIEDIMENMRA